MSIRSLSVAFVLVSLACGGTINHDFGGYPDPRQDDYILGIEDRIQVNVWKNPDMTGDRAVGPDGTISVPLVGEVKADGMTTKQLQKALQKKLAQFVKDSAAVVTVDLLEVNSIRFTVAGEVNQQGVFKTKRFVTVVEAIMLAGGFTRFARKESISIARTTNGRRVRIPVSYAEIIGGREEMNIVLLKGDEVYVP